MHGAAHNMAVTGRKSVQSLTTYQRVDTGDKIKMKRTLSENLVQEPKLKRQALPSRATLALPSTTNIHVGMLSVTVPTCVRLRPYSEQLHACYLPKLLLGYI
jgi:hypothetical protein